MSLTKKITVQEKIAELEQRLAKLEQEAKRSVRVTESISDASFWGGNFAKIVDVFFNGRRA